MKEKIPKKVYVIQGKYGTDVFSNLLKLSRAYKLFSYRQLRYALSKDKETTIGDYKIIKAEVK